MEDDEIPEKQATEISQLFFKQTKKKSEKKSETPPFKLSLDSSKENNPTKSKEKETTDKLKPQTLPQKEKQTEKGKEKTISDNKQQSSIKETVSTQPFTSSSSDAHDKKTMPVVNVDDEKSTVTVDNTKKTVDFTAVATTTAVPSPAATMPIIPQENVLPHLQKMEKEIEKWKESMDDKFKSLGVICLQYGETFKKIESMMTKTLSAFESSPFSSHKPNAPSSISGNVKTTKDHNEGTLLHEYEDGTCFVDGYENVILEPHQEEATGYSYHLILPEKGKPFTNPKKIYCLVKRQRLCQACINDFDYRMNRRENKPTRACLDKPDELRRTKNPSSQKTKEGILTRRIQVEENEGKKRAPEETIGKKRREEVAVDEEEESILAITKPVQQQHKRLKRKTNVTGIDGKQVTYFKKKIENDEEIQQGEGEGEEEAMVISNKTVATEKPQPSWYIYRKYTPNDTSDVHLKPFQKLIISLKIQTAAESLQTNLMIFHNVKSGEDENYYVCIDNLCKILEEVYNSIELKPSNAASFLRLALKKGNFAVADLETAVITFEDSRTFAHVQQIGDFLESTCSGGKLLDANPVVKKAWHAIELGVEKIQKEMDKDASPSAQFMEEEAKEEDEESKEEEFEEL